MSCITTLSVLFAQGQDAERLRTVVDRTTTEVKDYTIQYEDQRKIIKAFVSVQSATENKSTLDVVELGERRLDEARIRKVAPINNLTNCCITNNFFVSTSCNGKRCDSFACSRCY
jgi:hypothetical protein